MPDTRQLRASRLQPGKLATRPADCHLEYVVPSHQTPLALALASSALSLSLSSYRVHAIGPGPNHVRSQRRRAPVLSTSRVPAGSWSAANSSHPPIQFSPCRHGRPGIPHMPHVIRQIGTKKIALSMRGLGAHHLQPASATTPDGVLSDLLCAVQAVVCLAKHGILQKKRPSRLQRIASYIHSLAPWNTGSDLNLRRKGSVGSCAGLGRLQPAWRPDNPRLSRVKATLPTTGSEESMVLVQAVQPLYVVRGIVKKSSNK